MHESPAKISRDDTIHLELDGKTICFLSSGKSPQSILNEYCAKNRIRSAAYDVKVVSGSLFKARVLVDGIEAESNVEASKKRAKDSAATKLIDQFVRDGRFEPAKQPQPMPHELGMAECSDISAEAFATNLGGDSVFEVAQNLVYNAIQQVSFKKFIQIFYCKIF